MEFLHHFIVILKTDFLIHFYGIICKCKVCDVFSQIIGVIQINDISSVEETIFKDESSGRLKQVEKDIASLEKKRNKLTDMMLDDKISKEAYDEKYAELEHKLKKANDEKDVLSKNVLSQKNIQNRMRELRTKLAGADVLDKFDRVVFESIVQKVIVGEVAEDGTVDPYKLTFVLKGMDNSFIPDAKNRYKNLHKQAV